MNALVPLWQLPMMERDNRRMNASAYTWANISHMLTLAILFVSVAMYAATFGQRVRGMLLMALPAAALLLYGWYVFVGSMANACTTTSLALTPAFRRRVVAATILMWLALSMLMATFFASPTLFPLVIWALAAALIPRSPRLRFWALIAIWFWIAYSFGRLANMTMFSRTGWSALVEMLITMVAVAGGLLGLAGVVRTFPRLGATLCVAWFSFMNFSREISAMLPAGSPKLPFGISAQFVNQLLIAAALMGLTLYGLVGRRAGRNAGGNASVPTTQDVPAEKASSTKSHGWRWLHGAEYRHRLASVLARTRTQADRAGLIGFIFGRSAHWTSLVKMSAFFAIAVALLPTMMGNFFPGDLSTAMAILLPPGALLVARRTLEMGIWNTRREQQLLSLTPGWPKDLAIRNAVAEFVVRYVIVMFVSFSAALVIGLLLNPASAMAFYLAVAAVAVSTPLMLGDALRDYARMAAPGRASDLSGFTLAVVPLGILHFTNLVDEPVMLIAGILLICACVFAAWRGTRYRRLKKLLPAGSLAIPT